MELSEHRTRIVQSLHGYLGYLTEEIELVDAALVPLRAIRQAPALPEPIAEVPIPRQPFHPRIEDKEARVNEVEEGEIPEPITAAEEADASANTWAERMKARAV